jgi:hypothetical protein
MVGKCDICGFSIGGKQNYCSGCGVDLNELEGGESEDLQTPMIINNIEPSPGLNEEKKLEIIHWCWLRQMELPHVLVMISLLTQGKSNLGFCECAVYYQGYRELLAFANSLSGKKKFKASSREIVKMAREQDITKKSIDVAALLNILCPKKDNVTDKKMGSSPVSHSKVNEGKILIELDEAVIERAVVRVLSSDEGKEIIKNACTTRKKKVRSQGQ